MQPKYWLSIAVRIVHLLALAGLSALALAMPSTAAAQTEVPVAAFGSIELHDGATVILCHGPTQRVTLIKGSLDYTGVTVADGGRLTINKCKSRCPRGYQLEIEIVTSDVASIWVADGGTIQSHGNFPRKPEIEASVSQGGTIDIRSMLVDSVKASVEQGGIIFTLPQIALFARVEQGGNITYWGDPRVKSSVKNGGIVTKGTADQREKPLSELNPSLADVPSVPSVRPVQPLRNLRELRERR
jgi:Putative auto-transporter adhesin, head GIN domain